MDLEEAFRNVAADSMAQGFLLERMFRDYLLAMPKRERLAFAERMLNASERTDQFFGVTSGDDAAAERFADIVIRFQGCVDAYVGRALEQSEQIELASEARGDQDE